ncbi:MAG TPA: protein kinase [Microbacterium sp.]|nr:protein kinase [Microbacterium sp.]
MGEAEDPPTAALLDGRYELGECIGEGGMARVYRATDVALGRTVAIKMMRADAGALATPARARTEMTVLASLNHPSLVKLFDANLDPGHPGYLVMEFVEGTTLTQRLRQGPLDAPDAAHIAAELGSALHVVHAAGIVHRDVKPSNVLLTPTDLPVRKYHAKLADFGIAYLLDSTRVTSAGMVVGTGAYLAPEQVQGDPATPASDVYALGLVLLESLTGERAFGAAGGVGAVMARLVDPPKVPDRLGPRWSELLTRMTATDPAVRPTALDVARIAAQLPAQTIPAPPPAQTIPAPPPAQTIAAPPIPVLSAAEAASADGPTVLLDPPTRRMADQPAGGVAPEPAAVRPRRRAGGAVIAGAAVVAALALAAGVWTGTTAGTTVEPEPEPSAPAVTETSTPVEPSTPPSEPAAPVDPEEQKRAEEAQKKLEQEQKKAADEERKRLEEAEKKAEDERKKAEEDDGDD